MRALDGETIHIEAKPSSIDSSLVFETFVIPLKQNHEITGAVSMQRDITSIVKLTEELKKSNEQLKRSNEDLQQFAHVTSHDLKEPVRKIKMYGDILSENFANYLPDKGKDYLLRIDKSASRISAMIDGVLKYATIETSDQFLEDTDLMEIIDNIVEDLEIPIKENNSKIEFSGLPRIKAYPTLIYQLFYNLINNSLKFRNIEIDPVINLSRSELTNEEQGEFGVDYFKINLTDNGIGFDQAYAEKIFESFTRLHPKDKFEGTGLGLALCRKILLRHNGFIKASGELHKGTIFSIFLPKAILI
jgi:light-regulated signal transduction histidine kinase (bacteriophytochrome)